MHMQGRHLRPASAEVIACLQRCLELDMCVSPLHDRTRVNHISDRFNLFARQSSLPWPFTSVE